jgi:hypothetical protein
LIFTFCTLIFVIFRSPAADSRPCPDVYTDCQSVEQTASRQ